MKSFFAAALPAILSIEGARNRDYNVPVVPLAQNVPIVKKLRRVLESFETI
jgi:hypothetical protein